MNKQFRKFFALSLGIGGLILVGQQAQGQTAGPACGQRAEIVERLQSRYGEARRSMGLIENSTIIEIFTSEETGTWTILVTTAAGKTCLVAAGDDWQDAPDLAPASGEAA